jgi:hypothetical protein
MQPIYRAFVRFLFEEAAHSPVEYSAMLAMIILTVDVSVGSLGSYVTNPFWDTSNHLASQNAAYAKQTGQATGTVQGPGSGTVQVAGT